ncbi:MAG: AGE family epimerase/isomerase [Alphaproteobacteria bacterium]|nr:AGE family epimerase/isomerase [Alphaproteobacteria bacterium]
MTNAPRYNEVRRWMFDIALPFWARHGVDRMHGGFVEALTLDGKDAGAGFKRTRVTCRQIHVFSHAAMLGWSDGEAIARDGFGFLTQRTWLGRETGFARTLTVTGEALDVTPDLYDYAFVLFACAWRHRASQDPQALEWAHRTLDVIESKLRHPGGEGYWHRLPATGWREQNPHMHLLEAAIVLYETSGEARFGALATSIAKLFQTRFFDLRTGTLAEFFDDDWNRAPGGDGRIVEPGHQFEWAWILENCRRLGLAEASEAVRRLVEFGERYGVDPATGVTFNSVNEDGVSIDRGSRTWPNTERLKAAVALYELDGTDPEPVFASSSGVLLDRYLSHLPAGAWMDAFDAGGRPVAANVPASTFYHVFLAFAEMLRVADRLK